MRNSSLFNGLILYILNFKIFKLYLVKCFFLLVLTPVNKKGTRTWCKIGVLYQELYLNFGIATDTLKCVSKNDLNDLHNKLEGRVTDRTSL